MSVVLYRVDDRLVHGQVVIGWGKPLNASFIVLVDDEVAASDWERDLYRMGMPADVDLKFADVQQAIQQLPQWRADRQKGIVLTADIPTMIALCRGAGGVESVNLGGLHHKPGRSARLPYIYLTEDEYRELEHLSRDGVRVSAQDLPTSPAVGLEALQ